jgi:hypothetical protein
VIDVSSCEGREEFRSWNFREKKWYEGEEHITKVICCLGAPSPVRSGYL